MAPNESAARNAYRLAAKRLTTACRDLDGHLPPADEEDLIDIPPIWPTISLDATAECNACIEELNQLDETDRDAHTCTHRREPPPDSRPVEARKTQGLRKRQPNTGVIKADIAVLDERYENFTVTMSTMLSFMLPQEEEQFDIHFIRWGDYKRWIKDRALDTIALLEADTDRANVSTDNGNRNAVVTTGVDVSVVQTVPAATDELVHPASSGHIISSINPQSLHGNEPALVTMSAPVHTVYTQLGAQSLPGPSSVVSQPAGTSFVLPNHTSAPMHNTELELAVASLNSITDSINEDLQNIELEVATAELRNDGYSSDLKELCAELEKRVRSEFKVAVENLARADTAKSMNAYSILTASTKTYLDRIRSLQLSLRKARSTGTPEGSVVASFPSTGHHSSTYKPFLKKLDPPTFSGKVEDWPEFRSIWKELLADLPDSIQVQHFRSNIPVTDQKRVTGIKTMAEMWTRMEKVYGDVDLNIITIKSNLEGLAPMANQDHKRILEVFEAVETAVNQLRTLDALQYLQDDLGLMNKLIMKLPVATQTLYTQYVTSATVKANPASRWEKFWSWLEMMHDSAVQASLIQLCDKGSNAKTSPGSTVKSGATCNSCGGRGHYARDCPSKSRPSSVRVNVAVTKITTRDEYCQHLPETKRQLGDCPCCKQSPHMYQRKFPFGTAEWSSNRLESCPQFLSKSPRERGELIERLNGCYKCTGWKHLGDACFLKKKSNCTVVTSGTACSGVHHKLLHGSGVAFCHNIRVKVANTQSRKVDCSPVHDDMSLPDIDQPVLLEIQAIEVHGTVVKVMFDNGSSAALITHSLAQRLGLVGEKVEYWLMVVGHESVLRETMLYTFNMVDNDGQSHSMKT